MNTKSDIPVVFLKGIAVAVPPVILEHIYPAHPDLTFGIGLLGGVIIQHFIAPRGSIRLLVTLFTLALALAILSAVIK